MRVFILARIAVGMLSIALHVFFAVRLLRVHPLYLWHGGKAIFSAATVMLLVMLGTKWVMPRVFLGLGAFPQLAVAGVMAMASYILALRLFDAPFVAQLHRLALRALRR